MDVWVCVGLSYYISLPSFFYYPLQEHPSLGQLSEKLIDNNINVIFAVQGKQFHWYKVRYSQKIKIKMFAFVVEIRILLRSPGKDSRVTVLCTI